MVAGKFSLQVAPVKEKPRRPVLLDEARAELFGHLAFAATAPQVQLPQSVARGGKPLREEQVMLVLRIDVRHAVLVAQDFHRLAQSRDIDDGITANAAGAAGQQRKGPGQQAGPSPTLQCLHISLLPLIGRSQPAAGRGQAWALSVFKKAVRSRRTATLITPHRGRDCFPTRYRCVKRFAML